MFSALGFAAVKAGGWWVIAGIAVVLLTLIGAEYWEIHSLEGKLANANVRVGVLDTANKANALALVQCEQANAALETSVSAANLAVDALIAEAKANAEEAARRLAAAQADVAQNKRDANALAEALKKKGDIVRKGEPECVAAVRVIRENLR